jgi:hypothetical protein
LKPFPEFVAAAASREIQTVSVLAVLLAELGVEICSVREAVGRFVEIQPDFTERGRYPRRTLLCLIPVYERPDRWPVRGVAR